MERFIGKSFLVSLMVILTSGVGFAQDESNPNIKSVFVKVNPRGTYLFTDRNPPQGPPNWFPRDLAGPPTELDLSIFYNDPSVQLKTGDLIGFQLVGAYSAGPAFGDNIKSLLGVFYGFTGFIPVGPMTTAYSEFSLPTYSRQIPTDIMEDFGIPASGSTVYAQVPNGANSILFSVNDSFFSDNTDSNGDFGVWLKVTVIKKPRYFLKKKLFNNGVEVDPNFHTMPPSKYACGRSMRAIQTRTLQIQCLKEETNNGEIVATPASGCTVVVNFEDGVRDGGHNRHTHSDDPLRWGRFGNFSAGQSLVIPESGINLFYEAPEVAGDVVVSITASDPNGQDIDPTTDTVFQVRQDENWVTLNDIEGFSIYVASHLGDGTWVTQDTHDNWSKAVATFRQESAKSFEEGFVIPTLKSEGASLQWGGLFDIGRLWNPPHCGHRWGNEFDLSKSVFEVYDDETKDDLIEILKRSIRENGFHFPYSWESPDNPGATHWHVKN